MNLQTRKQFMPNHDGMEGLGPPGVCPVDLPWLDGITRARERVRVSTTMIYTHVLNRGGRGVVSPLDC